MFQENSMTSSDLTSRGRAADSNPEPGGSNSWASGSSRVPAASARWAKSQESHFFLEPLKKTVACNIGHNPVPPDAGIRPFAPGVYRTTTHDDASGPKSERSPIGRHAGEVSSPQSTYPERPCAWGAGLGSWRQAIAVRAAYLGVRRWAR